MDFGQRLSYLIERQLFMTIREFEKKCELAQGSIQRAINGTNIGIDKLEIISKKFPQINMDWLVSGDGEVIETDSILMEPTVRLYGRGDNEYILKTIVSSNEKLVDSISTLIKNNERLVTINEKMVEKVQGTAVLM